MQHKRVLLVHPQSFYAIFMGWPRGGYVVVVEMAGDEVPGSYITAGEPYASVEDAEKFGDLLASPWAPDYKAKPLPGSKFENELLTTAPPFVMPGK